MYRLGRHAGERTNNRRHVLCNTLTASAVMLTLLVWLLPTLANAVSATTANSASPHALANGSLRSWSGIAATPDGNGYWTNSNDGTVQSFGDAVSYGDISKIVLNKPVVGMAPTPDGQGYWLDAADGGIFTFGDARFWVSTGSLKLNSPAV